MEPFIKPFPWSKDAFLFPCFSVLEGFRVYLGEIYVNYVIRSRPQTASDILECMVYFKGSATSPSLDEADFFFFFEKNKVIRFSFFRGKKLFLDWIQWVIFLCSVKISQLSLLSGKCNSVTHHRARAVGHHRNRSGGSCVQEAAGRDVDSVSVAHSQRGKWAVDGSGHHTPRVLFVCKHLGEKSRKLGASAQWRFQPCSFAVESPNCPLQNGPFIEKRK